MKSHELGFSETENEDAQLGKRLKEAREYIGLKQDQVSAFLKVPRTAISEIENGKRGVGALELKKLARLYQRSLSWFTGEEPTDIPEDVAFLARTVTGLTNSDRQELQRFAEFLMAKSKAPSDDAA